MVIKALMLNITTRATTPEKTIARVWENQIAKREISNASPRKRLMASPGESGSADRTVFACRSGGLRTCLNRFLRNNAVVWT